MNEAAGRVYAISVYDGQTDGQAVVFWLQSLLNKDNDSISRAWTKTVLYIVIMVIVQKIWTQLNFTHSCLSSDSDSVHFVARHGVYFRRMLSPIGRNVQYCCSRYSASLASFTYMNRTSLWFGLYTSCCVRWCMEQSFCILELLFIRNHFFYTLRNWHYYQSYVYGLVVYVFLLSSFYLYYVRYLE